MNCLLRGTYHKTKPLESLSAFKSLMKYPLQLDSLCGNFCEGPSGRAVKPWNKTNHMNWEIGQTPNNCDGRKGNQLFVYALIFLPTNLSLCNVIQPRFDQLLNFSISARTLECNQCIAMFLESQIERIAAVLSTAGDGRSV